MVDTTVSLEEGDEEEGSDDEMDDEEFEKRAKIAQTRNKRGTVAGETWEEAEGWKPEVHKKTTAQAAKIEEAISRAFMFSGLPLADRKLVVDAFKGPLYIEPGVCVIRQGDEVLSESPGLFVIDDGQLDVFKNFQNTGGAGTRVFTYDKAGQIFGELALLYDCPRAATVISSSHCVLYTLDRNTFNHCVKGAQKRRRQRYECFLNSIELLKSLTEDERLRIADVLQPRDFRNGETIIEAGETGSELFLLESGTAVAVVDGQSVKSYGPSDYFGELALLKQQARAASVVATSAASVAVLDATSFKRMLGSLDVLMAQRAQSYDQVLGKVETQEANWVCESKWCRFWNFGRNDRCMRCGLSRIQRALAVPRLRKLGTVEECRFTSRHVAVSCVEGEGSSVVFARYAERLQVVGMVQCLSPMTVGERFCITVHNLGTFGEIGIGVAERLSERRLPHAKLPTAKSFWAASDAAIAPGMVGWSVNEAGCHGDHGMWYQNGKTPGRQVCPPWEEGDIIELEIAPNGGISVLRNTKNIANIETRWPMEFAYPTATLHSQGAEITINFSKVTIKAERAIALSAEPEHGLKDALERHHRGEARGQGPEAALAHASWRGSVLNWWWKVMGNENGCCQEMQFASN